MRRGRAVAAVVLTLGCEAAPWQGGQLEARWEGKDPGGFSAPATASWCADMRLLEIVAVKGDTGVALAILPAGELEAGSYSNWDVARGEPPRPVVMAAARWFTNTAVAGFRGDSGRIELATERGEASGRFDFRMYMTAGSDTVRLHGQFDGVPIDTGTACPTAPAAAPPAD